MINKSSIYALVVGAAFLGPMLPVDTDIRAFAFLCAMLSTYFFMMARYEEGRVDQLKDDTKALYGEFEDINDDASDFGQD